MYVHINVYVQLTLDPWGVIGSIPSADEVPSITLQSALPYLRFCSHEWIQPTTNHAALDMVLPLAVVWVADAGSDPRLLWLWCRPLVTAPIRPLAWEPPYVVGAAQGKAKRQKKKKKKKDKLGEPYQLLFKTKQNKTKNLLGYLIRIDEPLSMWPYRKEQGERSGLIHRHGYKWIITF